MPVAVSALARPRCETAASGVPGGLKGSLSCSCIALNSTRGAGHGRPSAIVAGVDEGLPIAYQLLEQGVPVLASDGQQVGTVAHVLSAPESDIFHGLLIDTASHGVRFIEAAGIASIHEHGVDLRIDSTAAAALPPPEHAAPVYNEDPQHQQAWRHWVHRITGASDWRREH